MAASIYSGYPPILSPEQEAYLTQATKDWSIEHGLTVRPSPSFISSDLNRHGIVATNAPVTLFPSPFPQSCFEHARSLQTIYNALYAAVANDEDWLEDVLNELIEVDDFIARLWNVHLTVKKEGYVQALSLGLFRSDYMLHMAPSVAVPSLKQVEFNTISSSFGGLANLATRLHTHLITFPTPATHLAYPPHPLFESHPSSPEGRNRTGIPPPNVAVETLTNGLAAAHEAYGSSKSSPPLPLCILFLVQDHERNVFDQLALSSYLHAHHNIPTFRLSISKILLETTIPSSNPARPLLYTPPSAPHEQFEATVVYFRAFYAPAEYTNGNRSWDARLHLERSCAIKCPTALTQLAGCKKIQQVLTSTFPDHLSRFLPDQSHIYDSLRQTFAPQYSLAPNSEGVKLALDPSTAAKHVLKPQREGGGNNIYRDKIPGFLRGISEKDYGQYILMELIQPPAHAKNTVLKSDGSVVGGNVISELGIFGTCLWRRRQQQQEQQEGEQKALEILHNEEGGYLLRTKARESDEGGVAAGFSSLDNLVLY